LTAASAAKTDITQIGKQPDRRAAAAPEHKHASGSIAIDQSGGPLRRFS
jgi:hypothetical protein